MSGSWYNYMKNREQLTSELLQILEAAEPKTITVPSYTDDKGTYIESVGENHIVGFWSAKNLWYQPRNLN